MHFKRFTIDNGLSQNTINTLYEDKNGFIWIGTDDGLNRYDGINTKIFHFNLHNNNSISNNQINSIIEDKDNNIWVATANGLSKINNVTNTITRYYQDKIQGISNNYISKLKIYNSDSFLIASINSISLYNNSTKKFTKLINLDNRRINDFIVDNSGDLWIATDEELLLFKTQEKKRLDKTPFNPSFKYQKLLLDDKNQLWIGSDKGIKILDTKLNEVTPENLYNTTKSNSIKTLFEDNTGTIWIGTENGLKSYSSEKKHLVNFKNYSNNLNSLSNNDILTIIQDKSETLWIGTYHGLNSLMLKQKNFNHISLFPEHTNNLSTNLIWCFTKDEKQHLWIGTANGLHVYNERDNVFKSISIEGVDDKQKRSIYYIYFDTYGNLWTGGNYGVHYLTPKDISRVWEDEDVTLKKIKSTPLNNIEGVAKFIETPETKELWIGSLDHGVFKALNTHKNPNEINFKQYKNIKNDSTSLPSNTATNIIQLKENNKYQTWIGTSKGLSKYNPSLQNFKTYNFNRSKEVDLQVSALNSFNDSILWVGTFNSGLIKFNLKTQDHQYINSKIGLASNCIYSILNHKDDLWFSTTRGLSKYNIKTHKIKNYDKSFGLQDNEYGEGAYFIDKTNKFYFGGINGYNAFYPDNITNNKIPPKINFIDFKIFNQSVIPNVNNTTQKLSKDKTIILKKSITYSDTINLSYKHSVFSFKVAIIHNKNSDKNIYAYKLSSIDKDWNIRPSTQNQFTYTNLNPGKYTLQIKAANSD